MPSRVIKLSDEWADLNKALAGYKKFLEALRENASRSVNEVLDQIEERAEAGEDFDSLLDEYSTKNDFFKKWVKEVDSKDEESNGGSGGYTKGQELSGTDSEGNEVSGEYVRSVFGRPQIDTPAGPVVLSEVN